MISALERLRNLRAGSNEDRAGLTARYSLSTGTDRQSGGRQMDHRVPPLPTCPADLSLDWRIEWEERAAILEYEGGLNREEADQRAFVEILGGMKRP